MAGRGQVIGNKREIQSKLHCHLSEKQTVQNAYKLLIYNCYFYSFSVQRSKGIVYFRKK